LGIGVYSTAAKKGMLEQADYLTSVEWMTRLNSVGAELGGMSTVKAMTDVTGFGLLGHLLEICEGSHLAAQLNFELVPTLENLKSYIERNCIPGGTYRNWKSYGSKIGEITEFQKLVLADPQTSGGLLIAADADASFLSFARSNGFIDIGSFEEYGGGPYITIP
jgi:selenide,water dikinase